MASDAEAEGADLAGEAAIRDALAEHGDDVAAAIERTDEIKEVIDLAILTIAAADDDEVDHVTEVLSNLIQAVDGLSTEGAVALADAVGENGDELASAMASVAELEREGQLDALVELAAMLSTVDVDESAMGGLERFAGAVGEAESEAEPVGVLGFLGALRTPDVRAGLGYLLAILRGLGRRE